jgi:MFS family permease
VITELLLAICVVGLGWLSYTQGSITLIYLFLLGIGIARAFNDPASSTLLPEVIPPELFSSAAPWNSSVWHFASVTGPAFAGLLVGFFNSVTFIYVFDALAAVAFCIMKALARAKIRDHGFLEGRSSFYETNQGDFSCDHSRHVCRAIWWCRSIVTHLCNR